MTATPRAPRLAAASIAALAVALAACSSGGPGGGGGGSCALPPRSELQAVALDPPSGATGAFVGTRVSARFNTCLDPATLGAGLQLSENQGPPVAGTVTYDAPTATLVLTPVAPLAYGTRYMAYVPPTVKGAHGEELPLGVVWIFQTQAAPELVPPTTTASPAGGWYNAPPSVTLACADNPGGTGCRETRYTLDGTTPNAASRLYTAPISITATATLRFFSVDWEGNAEAPRSETYVLDTTPPTVEVVTPAAGATQVPLVAPLTVRFSEDMRSWSLYGTTVTLDHGVTATFLWNAAARTLEVTPTERLACGTTYHATVGTAAQDLAGNHLAAPYAWSFTAHADCDEPVTTASVAGGVYASPQQVTLTCSDGAGGSGCARIAYTTDGSVPTTVPPHGTVVPGSVAGPIAVGAGDTLLRWFAEDAAGNREVVREERYAVSTSGFTYVATSDGLARGVGPAPASFVPIRSGGRTRAFFRDATNGRLYRGTERGLLWSDDGLAWSYVQPAPHTIANVSSVHARGSKVFVGTASYTTPGLWVSQDGGATFAGRDLGSEAANWIHDVVASGEDVYVATDGGLYVSRDKGQTFAPAFADAANDLALDGGALYVATAAGLRISTDGARTFVTRTTAEGLPSDDLSAVAASGSRVYAGTGLGLGVSSDGGATFAVRTAANGLEDDVVLSLFATGASVYAVTDTIYGYPTAPIAISTDGGATFTAHAFYPPDDQRAATAVYAEGSRVFVGASPTWYRSTDGGVTYAAQDLATSGVNRVTGSGGTLYLSAGGALAITSDGGRSFTIRNQVNGIGSNSIDDLFVDGPRVYVGTWQGLGVSTDGGLSFDNRTGSNSGLWNNGVAACVAASGSTIWVGTTTTIDVSTNGGQSFARLLTGTATPEAIAVSGSDIYLATSGADQAQYGGGLQASNDGGATFAKRTTASGLPDTSPRDVTVAGSKVLVATDAGLYESTDRGATFSRNAALGATFASGVDAFGPFWYVSTATAGLAISTDAGATWSWRAGAEGIDGPAQVHYVP